MELDSRRCYDIFNYCDTKRNNKLYCYCDNRSCRIICSSA